MMVNYTVLVLAVLLIVSEHVLAGIEVGGTRVIYDGGKKEASLSIRNPDKNNVFLIQSWLDNGDESSTSKVPFVVTPPLFRIDPMQENQLRIINTATPPQDRESLYWLSVKSIAATPREGNRLQIAIRTRIKMIYRPTLIKNSADKAYTKLIVSRNANTITFTNPTPHYISFFSIKVGSQTLDQAAMVAPFETYRLNTPPGVSGKISWRAINDYGGNTDEMSGS